MLGTQQRTVCMLSTLLFLVGVLMPVVPVSGEDKSESGKWDVKVKIDIDWEAVGKAAKDAGKKVYKLWFTKHKSVQAIYKINGKSVIVVPIDAKAGGTRITNNINMDAAWKGVKGFEKTVPVQILLANVPANLDPVTMVFQQKWDAENAEDPNKGPELKHGMALDFDWGHDRYFANRSDIVFSGAYILIVEQGITKDDINQLPGIKVN